MNQAVTLKKEIVDRLFGDGTTYELTSEDVEVERRRAAAVLTARITAAVKRDAIPLANCLLECRDEILSPSSEFQPKPESAPPPPEPMTIDKVTEKWHSKAICFDWSGFGKDLTDLVEGETQRIAHLIRNVGLGHAGINDPDVVADQVLRSAGLK